MATSFPFANFDVLVGSPPDQKASTVPHALLVNRSEFFNTTRSARGTTLTPSSLKPVDLTEEGPDVFMAYLHCVCWDVIIRDPRTEGDVQRYDDLIELYTLADRLMDFTTANLVIDKIISSAEKTQQFPSIEDIKLV